MPLTTSTGKQYSFQGLARHIAKKRGIPIKNAKALTGWLVKKGKVSEGRRAAMKAKAGV